MAKGKFSLNHHRLLCRYSPVIRGKLFFNKTSYKWMIVVQRLKEPPQNIINTSR